MSINRKVTSKYLYFLVIITALMIMMMPLHVFALDGPGEMRRSVATFVCTGDYVNIRSGPGTSYSSRGYLMKGNTGYVQRWSADKKWAVVCPVAPPNKPSGWVYYQYLSLGQP